MTTGATSSLERITIKLPDDFDPQRHGRAIEFRIAKEYGAGFAIDNVDLTKKTVTASRLAAIAEVTQDEHDDSFQVRLGGSLSKPSAGEKAAAKFQDQHPGYYMTSFEPFLDKATLTRLNDDEARCRGALAVALGVKPWDVQVKSTPTPATKSVSPAPT